MQRVFIFALLASAIGMSTAQAQPMPLSPSPYAQPGYRGGADLGGGFIEFLFGGGQRHAPYHGQAQREIVQPMAQPAMSSAPVITQGPASPPLVYAHGDPGQAGPAPEAHHRPVDARYMRQIVAYAGAEKPGTIIIDTPRRFLFLVEDDGKAVRYGIGVGRPGFTWAGVKHISAKREWPDWRPPKEMLERRPDLPRYMAGGPDNPLGARALYLGSSLYRIHGSNEPWTIGNAVSSGCIRMRNEDVVDLYERVKVGTKVIVI